MGLTTLEPANELDLLWPSIPMLLEQGEQWVCARCWMPVSPAVPAGTLPPRCR